MQLGRRNALLAIGVGGLIAGALDITQAIILFGKEVPLVIAAGVLGKGALRGGAGTYALGLFLHFFIATSVATIYYVASRRLKFLAEHWIVCGLFYGAAVDQVMALIACYHYPRFTPRVRTNFTTCFWESSSTAS